jgi:signal transduction histidine kinase
MDISKFENGDINYDLKPIDGEVLVNQIVADMQLVINTHEILFEPGGVKTNVLVDQLRIEQVLNNLLNNAAKYSITGTKISVTTQVDTDTFRISVKDEGIGMPPMALQNVFEKFYRVEDVKRKYSGLGMGLYIASRIVSDHNGKISVESEEGLGSIFSVSLPIQRVM